MRPVLLPLAALALVAASGAPAQAQNYPWCAMFADGAGANCGFSTYQQCMATAQGSGGYCEKNNVYEPPHAAAPPRQAARTHRSKFHARRR
jgi:hypothetical protein